MLPFGNTIVVVAVTGAKLIEALENGVSMVETLQGRFPQVRYRTPFPTHPLFKRASVCARPWATERGTFGTIAHGNVFVVLLVFANESVAIIAVGFVRGVTPAPYNGMLQ